MRFAILPPGRVDPLPVHPGMPSSDAADALAELFGFPPVRFRIYRGEGWEVPRPGLHDAGLLFFDGGGPTIQYLELGSGATSFFETIENFCSDEVVLRGIELFNANSSEVLAALRALQLDIIDESGYGDKMSIPELGLGLTRASARQPDDDPEESPDTPWSTVVVGQVGMRLAG